MLYRVICCSDTHGVLPILPDYSGGTALLHGGDFYDGKLLRHAMAKASTPEDFEALKNATDFSWIDLVPMPIYAVKGNHDVADPLGIFSSIISAI